MLAGAESITTGIMLLVFILQLFVYEPVHDSFYAIANLGERYESDFFTSEIKNTAENNQNKQNAVDLAFQQTLDLQPESGMYFVWKQDENSPIITGGYPKSLHFDHQSNYQFHPKTGALLRK